jgi:hypothetical protein
LQTEWNEDPGMRTNTKQLVDDPIRNIPEAGDKGGKTQLRQFFGQSAQSRCPSNHPKTRTNTLGRYGAAVMAALILLGMLLGAFTPVQADRGRREAIRDNDYNNRRGYILDRRYNHNRHYPQPGLRVNRLPPGSRFSPYRNRTYYYNDGAWYLPSRRGFSVILPPVGLTIPLLPPFYTTIWVRDRPYYYADGVYYVWRPEDRVYVVSEPPPATEVIEQSAIPEQIFVYPKAGQSAAQQETDRYECHRWAVGQTSFDPTQPGGNVPADHHSGKRLEYQRAMKACLEARNYSVQ